MEFTKYLHKKKKQVLVKIRLRILTNQIKYNIKTDSTECFW